jgi:hypothetical protein
LGSLLFPRTNDDRASRHGAGKKVPAKKAIAAACRVLRRWSPQGVKRFSTALFKSRLNYDSGEEDGSTNPDRQAYMQRNAVRYGVDLSNLVR